MKLRKRALSCLLTLAMLAGLLPALAVGASAAGSSGVSAVTIRQSAKWDDTVPGRSVADVQINVQSEMDLQKPKDVVFVIDRAASQNLSLWKHKATELANLLGKVRGMRYALVTYDTRAETRLEFTDNVSVLRTEINKLSTGSNCNGYAGFLKAKELIDGRTAPAQEACVVLLSTAKFNLNIDKTLSLGRQLKAAVPVYGIDGTKYNNTWMATVCTSVESVEGIAMAVGESRTCPGTAVTVTVGNDFTAVGDEGDGTLTFPIPNFQMGRSYTFHFSAKLKDRAASGTLTASESASLAGTGLTEVSAGPATVQRSTLSVTYTANGGTGTVPVDNGRYNQGDTVAVKPAGNLRKQGWNFSGWRHPTLTLTDGTFPITENTELEAAWGRAFVKLSSSTAASNLKGTQMLSRAAITTKYSDGAFYNSTYWNNLTSVTLRDSVRVPMSAVAAWDITDTSNPDENDLKAVMAWVVRSPGNSTKYDLYIGGRGGLTAPADCSNLFKDCSASTIGGLDILNTSGVTNMASMFSGCTKLSASPLNLSGWDVSHVTAMNNMFSSCSVLSGLNLDWGAKTSIVTDISGMFSGCSKLGSLIGEDRWNTSSLTSATSIFSGCRYLSSPLDTYSEAQKDACLDVSGWNTSKLTSFYRMFYDTGITTIDLSKWNTSNVETTSEMFRDSRLKTIDLTAWNSKVKNLTSTSGMFRHCVNLHDANLSGWSVPKLTNMSYMFCDCTGSNSSKQGLNTVNLTGWSSTGELQNLTQMFYSCQYLEHVNISGWNTPKITSLKEMFYNCAFTATSEANYIGLRSLDLRNWTVGFQSGADVSKMFYYCDLLQTLSLGSWNTSNVTNMEGMFSRCKRLTSVDPSSWNTSNVINMKDMFNDCWQLPSLNLGNWNMRKVQNMDNMFNCCSALTSIGRTRLDIAEGGTAQYAFFYVHNLDGKITVYAGPDQIYPKNTTRSAAPLMAPPVESAPSQEDPEVLPPVVETPVVETPPAETPPQEETPPREEAAGEEAIADTEGTGDTELLQPEAQAPGEETLSASSVQSALPSGAVDPDALDINGRPVYANKKIGLWNCGEVGPDEPIEYALELQYLNDDLGKGGASGPLTVTNRIPDGLTYNDDAVISSVLRIDGADGGETGGEVLQPVQVSGNVLTFTVTGLSAGAKYVVTYSCTTPSSSDGYTEFLNTASVTDNGMEDRADPVLHYMNERPENQYAVTYSYENGPAGAVVPNPQSCTGGTNISLPVPGAAEGYQFDGWKENGAGDVKSGGTPYTVSGDVHFVGVWSEDPAAQPKTVRLDYRFDGADSDLPENEDLILAGLLDGVVQELPENTNTAIPKLAVLPEGWTLRWRGPEGLLIAEDGSFNTGLQSAWPDGTISITGEWTRKSYAVTYQYTGAPAGAEPPAESLHPWGEAVTLAPEPPSTETHLFQGWTGVDTDASGRFQMPKGGVTITGTWAPRPEDPKDREVRVDPNGGFWQGSEEESVLTLEEYEELAESFPDPERQGCTFLSWEERDDPEGLFAKILTASWKENTPPPSPSSGAYTVTFNAQGGSPVPSRTANRDSKLTRPADPVREGYIFRGWYRDQRGTRSWNFAVDTVTGNLTLYAKWNPDTPVFEVSGTVVDMDGNPVPGVLVRIVQGNSEFKRTTTGLGGQYTFGGVSPGLYNVVATYNGITTTILVAVSGKDLSGQDIFLPPDKTNSVLEVDREAPDVVVGGLEQEAASIRKSEADGAADVNVKVSMDVKPTSEAERPTAVQAIRQVARQSLPQAKLDLILEIDVTKTLIRSGAPEEGSISRTANVLEIVIPYDMTGKAGIKVHRYHDAGGDHEGALTFGELPARPGAAERTDATFYLDRTNELIHVYARKFSTYAVSYVPGTPPLSGGGSGSGSGNSGSGRMWIITASAGKGGTIRPEGKTYVPDGSDQAFAIRPDSGYAVRDIRVDGKSAGTGQTYAFRNVHADHTIEAVFAPLDSGVSALLNDTDHGAYLHGFRDGNFHPNGSLTRAQAAQLFYNLLRERNIPGESAFTDVPAGMWCADAVNTLNAMGVMRGVDGARFLPDRPITRAEFVVTAVRFAGKTAPDAAAFSDVTEDQWFYDQVMGAAGYGWIGGYSDGTFRPYAPITRAEAAAVVNRMLNRAADRAYADAHAILRFPDVPSDYWAYYDIAEASNAHNYTREDGRETWTELNPAKYG